MDIKESYMTLSRELGKAQERIKMLEEKTVLPLDWENTEDSASVHTALGTAKIYKRADNWGVDLINHDLKFFNTAEEAKEHVQLLHNHYVIAWLA